MCCWIKERAEPFVRDTHRYRQRDSFERERGGRHRLRLLPQTDREDRRPREKEIENSNLGSLRQTAPRKVLYNVFFLMWHRCIIGDSELSLMCSNQHTLLSWGQWWCDPRSEVLMALNPSSWPGAQNRASPQMQDPRAFRALGNLVSLIYRVRQR